jgi:hypothetical protein
VGSSVFACDCHIICPKCLEKAPQEIKACPQCRRPNAPRPTVVSKIYLNKRKQEESKIQDARPNPVGALMKMIEIFKEEGDIVFTFFRNRTHEFIPLSGHLDENLLPVLNHFRLTTRKVLSESVLYHELLVTIADARQMPSRDQVNCLYERLIKNKNQPYVSQHQGK